MPAVVAARTLSPLRCRRAREAKAVVERWNEQLAAGRDMLWSPTIRAALIAGNAPGSTCTARLWDQPCD